MRAHWLVVAALLAMVCASIDCKKARSDEVEVNHLQRELQSIPLPADADSKGRVFAFRPGKGFSAITLQSDKSLEQLCKAYEDKLSSQGWTMTQHCALSQARLPVLTFSNGKRSGELLYAGPDVNNSSTFRYKLRLYWNSSNDDWQQ